MKRSHLQAGPQVAEHSSAAVGTPRDAASEPEVYWQPDAILHAHRWERNSKPPF